MEWKSLIAGLVFTMGIYAIKCGIGLACGFVDHEKTGHRIYFVSGAILAYALLFGGSYLLLTHVNLLNQLLIVQQMVEWAMAVHLAMATLLLVWGSSLLKQPTAEAGPVRGWWLFALPCPVCMGVILLTVAFVMGFYPEKSIEMTLVAWGVFVSVGSASFLVSRALGDRFRRPHHFMGTMMVLAALWFLLSVLVVPHVSELPDVFAMASNSAASTHSDGGASLWVIVSSLCLFVAGIYLDTVFCNHSPPVKSTGEAGQHM